MSRFVAVARALARRGFAVISIDYRCEGRLRGIGDFFHPWYDAVEDARAAVRYMVGNAARLQLDTGRIVAFGGSAGAVTVAQLLHALPDSVPMPPGPPLPPSPPGSENCTAVCRANCPRPFPGGYDECLACTRQHAARPICRPIERARYCNSTTAEQGVQRTGTGQAGGNVTCGIALSGAIVPSSIAAGQVTASVASAPYLDFHGTAVRYHSSASDLCVLLPSDLWMLHAGLHCSIRLGPSSRKQPNMGRCCRHKILAGQSCGTKLPDVYTWGGPRSLWCNTALRPRVVGRVDWVLEHDVLWIFGGSNGFSCSALSNSS